MAIEYWTDGACSRNPGPGGWSYIRLENINNKICIWEQEYGFTDNTTNNAMELTAILAVLKHIYILENMNEEFCKKQYIIHSDSAYAINSITQWMVNWERNNWTRGKGQKVENLELMKEIYDYYIIKNLQCQVEFDKVHGHCGLLGNELCDALCSRNKTKYINLIHKNNIEEYDDNNIDILKNL